ncbi:CHY zinc finger protein [Cryobacterium sp. SO2]|uniref:CHY zinc finger protein n=1 Tax=Cryobacterium sp. SO2 TaxID=1897060 RepID=UPI00223D3DFD|nr:CHY zinc finger protein [Cryobacterium sp. SO2]WEO77875.1 CHY zinc finger protein [Cryobacterium sp. SO2]
MNEETARLRVYGAVVDVHTRCVHYNGSTDVIAIKFRCCGRFYPCFQCHAEAESHPAEQWAPEDWAEQAILCGACWHTLAIDQYRGVSACPHCGAAFNDGCRLHAHLYFQVPDPQSEPRG